jgi:hypothetical protein
MKLIGSALVLAFVLMSQGAAQTAQTAYPKMAPPSQYLISRDAEIAGTRARLGHELATPHPVTKVMKAKQLELCTLLPLHLKFNIAVLDPRITQGTPCTGGTPTGPRARPDEGRQLS